MKSFDIRAGVALVGMFGVAIMGVCAPALAAPAEEATVPVSLSIEQSCVIETSGLASERASPRVACEHNEPFNISNVDADPTRAAAPIEAQRTESGIWMVSF
jgi:hypothetical protein